LSLWDEGYSDRALRAVAAGSFAQLRELSCMGQFTPAGGDAVLNSPAARTLTDVTPGHRAPRQTAHPTRPRPGLADVVVAGGLPQLEFAWLSGCGLTNAGLTRLASRGRFTRLQRLHLGDDPIGRSAVYALDTGHFPALTDLELTQCGPSDEWSEP